MLDKVPASYLVYANSNQARVERAADFANGPFSYCILSISVMCSLMLGHKTDYYQRCLLTCFFFTVNKVCLLQPS